MNLFVIYIGGKTHNSNIELHDVRFAVGNAIEDCYEKLRQEWWGTPKSLHLDCWGILDYADGYDITLKTTPYKGSQKLYFLNLGGYDPSEFTELHRNVFVVAETEQDARAKALANVKNWKLPHKDVQIEVELAICLNDEKLQNNYSLHLTKTDIEKPFSFVCEYRSIAIKIDFRQR